MRPLTENTPKPMIKVADKPLLEHILNDLPESVDEVILVVGYLKDQIISCFGDKFRKVGIKYVYQKENLGTYNALELCKDLIGDDEKFIVAYADDFHGADNFKKCSECDSCAMLVLEAEDPRKFGVVDVDESENILGIEEKPENPKTNLVSTGVLVLDSNVFKYPARRHSNGEYYVTDSIAQMIEAGHRFKAIRSNFWLPIGYPSDLEKAEQILNRKSESQNTKS
ncbi:MAG: Nucleotidyl transferase [Candidatus Yanofskybacteria bacterium GW2011_GWA2_44_9]|nr:MAG: Nucleotidyl transferase [Candidatus Yanofskybacteria bacterium GW2011_GWA2_44_9]